MALDRWLHIVRLRLRSLLRGQTVESELAEELRFHVDERARELMARGMSPADARDAALRAFGGVEQRKEQCRDARRIGLIDAFRSDVRYAVQDVEP